VRGRRLRSPSAVRRHHPYCHGSLPLNCLHLQSPASACIEFVPLRHCILRHVTLCQIQFDPTVGRDPESFLDAASLSAIAVVVSKFEPPPAIRHFLLPPPDQQLPKRISLKALKSLASCSGSQQLPAQEFLENFQGLWDLVGDDFVEPAQLRQLLVQVKSLPACLSRFHV
jgi:hypothetical protein